MPEQKLISADKIDYITSRPMKGRTVILLPTARADWAAGYVALKEGPTVYFGLRTVLVEHPDHSAASHATADEIIEDFGKMDAQWPCRSAARLAEQVFGGDAEAVYINRSIAATFGLEVDADLANAKVRNPVLAIYSVVRNGPGESVWQQTA